MGGFPLLPAGVPLCSDLLGIRDGSCGTLRRAARRPEAIWRVLRCHPFAKGGYDPVVNAARKVRQQRLVRSAKPRFASMRTVGTLAEFQNPQQEPGMERRLLLVFALDFPGHRVVPAAAEEIFARSPPAPAARRTSQAAGSAAQRATSPAAQARSGDSAGATKQAASAESETVIENDLYRITFTNRGGQVKSWILKKL